ncbi:MAG: DUF1844 domain-containing protein [Pirellulales bacterium]|nr:DUF1844 domain-containing protein [Pirellulales bacterium]
MTDEPQDPQPKIIVDEDWKSQVEAEKAKLSQEKSAPAESPRPTEAASAASPETPVQFPEASLTGLISMLATQVMIALGYVPHPATGKPERSLPEAKYMIDLITMLEEKTQGNRTPQEISVLSSVLHELRMAYVEAQSKPNDAPSGEAK